MTSVADHVIAALRQSQIDTLFCLPGVQNDDFFDRLVDAPDIRPIVCRHEQGTAYMAMGAAQVTGKPAACFAIAGPGATNLYTGLWDAKVDRAPILALTGQVATQVVGTGNFQELDLVRAFQTVAEFNHRVQGNSRHAELMSLAVKHAILKRDVSHLTFPDEIQIQKAPPKAKAQDPEGRITPMQISPPEYIALAVLSCPTHPMCIIYVYMKVIVSIQQPDEFADWCLISVHGVDAIGEVPNMAVGLAI